MLVGWRSSKVFVPKKILFPRFSFHRKYFFIATKHLSYHHQSGILAGDSSYSFFLQFSCSFLIVFFPIVFLYFSYNFRLITTKHRQSKSFPSYHHQSDILLPDHVWSFYIWWQCFLILFWNVFYAFHISCHIIFPAYHYQSSIFLVAMFFSYL